MLLNTLIIGKVLKRYNRLNSTNLFSKELLAKSKPIEGTVILAEEQTAGRGQFGNVWKSEAGKNLTLSVIVYPNFLSPKEQFYLSKIVSIACCETVKQFLPREDIKIKWPNDIYVAKEKIGGILIENQINQLSVQSAVLGIGLNINQLEFPVNFNATSLCKMSNYAINKEHLLNALIKQLDKWYLALRNLAFTEINQTYFSNFYQKNELVNFRKLGQQMKDNEHLPEQFKAKVIACTEHGQLVLEINENKHYFNFKEVQWLL